MRKTFDAELVELSHELTAMGTTTQDAIDLVTASLTQGKAEGAKATIAMRNTMDQMERDIENRCMSLLMRQQPVARDLRTISAAMKMVTDLQRIGDQAANIAEISLLIAESGDKPDVPEEIVDAVRDALTSEEESTAYNEWYNKYKESVDVVINDMPEDVPYNVDLSGVEPSTGSASAGASAGSDETMEKALAPPASNVTFTLVSVQPVPLL